MKRKGREMNKKVRAVALATTVASLAFTSISAHAEGTIAGTNIINNVTVNYSVGGVNQTAKTASDTFTVDRKVNFTVVEDGNLTTTVAPGATNAVTAFLITNTSNSVLDLALAATQLSGGTAAHGGTDSFDATNVRVYLDSNNNGQYDAGVDQAVSYIDEIAADATVRILVVSDIPLSLATGSVAGVQLAATAHSGGSAGTQGDVLVETVGGNTPGIDTVFADDVPALGGNVTRDGVSFAYDDYTVSTAAISLTKSSRVISDPLNGTTNPKLIPGAIVEYCIAVQNSDLVATATNVTVSDTLPAQTTFLSTFSMLINGTTVTEGVCSTNGTVGGSHAAGVVTAPLSDIGPGAIRTVLFRATIN
jgi:uncharacterized repeat protein (TIGR01451 family)